MRPRIYRRPDPTIATGVFREHKPRVSCAHDWVSPFGDVEICTLCSASCKRGPDGRIVEYATKEEAALEAEERAAAAAEVAA